MPGWLDLGVKAWIWLTESIEVPTPKFKVNLFIKDFE